MDYNIMKINFKITTPERVVYDEEVEQVTLPTAEGEITILPNHIALVASLVPGELKVKLHDQDVIIAVSGGFVEFNNNNLTVLADTAERGEEIDLARAEAAHKKAEEIMKEKVGAEDFAEAQAMMVKELVRVKVARKHSHRGHHGVGSEGVMKE